MQAQQEQAASDLAVAADLHSPPNGQYRQTGKPSSQPKPKVAAQAPKRGAASTAKTSTKPPRPAAPKSAAAPKATPKPKVNKKQIKVKVGESGGRACREIISAK